MTFSWALSGFGKLRLRLGPFQLCLHRSLRVPTFLRLRLLLLKLLRRLVHKGEELFLTGLLLSMAAREANDLGSETVKQTRLETMKPTSFIAAATCNLSASLVVAEVC